jgi:hypothetical protein
LYSDFVKPEWPDRIDDELGLLTYYGDNRRPGHALHDTRKKGNELLRRFFDAAHSNRRESVPAILVFGWAAQGRDVTFKGLAVPGGEGISVSEDLVAIWKSRDGGRFQNYKATFTILDAPLVSREWINDIVDGSPETENAPSAWIEWRTSGRYKALRAMRTIRHRRPAEQLPVRRQDLKVLETIDSYFTNHKDGKYAFEACAAEIVKLALPAVTEIDLTRPWRDGGRDALGKFRIGNEAGGIAVEFAMEAKCKKPRPTNSCGVKEVSRLISRLRYRQFGVFVTTSCIGQQAYEEIVEDGHPVVVIAGSDICSLLTEIGLSDSSSVKGWLETRFR